MRYAEASPRDQFSQLQRAKDESLERLLGRKPGQEHYRRELRTFLEADDALQRAIIERLGLDFRE